VLNLSRFNNNGNWIRGFSHNLGITTSLVTKMWGLCDGLSLACGLNISKLVIEINAKSMVDLLRPVNVDNTASHPYSALINNCKCLILSFEETILHHVHHKSNFCTNLLANDRSRGINF
jgi:hypothetical protein